MLLVKRQPLNISHVYVYHVEGYRPGGGLYVFSPSEEGGEMECIFDAGKDGMITTADISYDGREVVFAMRRGGLVASRPVAHIEDISRYQEEASNYQVFRINIDGSGLTQLTHGAHNNPDPCWLPDGGIAFISDRKPVFASKEDPDYKKILAAFEPIHQLLEKQPRADMEEYEARCEKK